MSESMVCGVKLIDKYKGQTVVLSMEVLEESKNRETGVRFESEVGMTVFIPRSMWGEVESNVNELFSARDRRIEVEEDNNSRKFPTISGEQNEKRI